MSDPKPEVMFVDGGVVSAEACGIDCTCDRHGVRPRPDWEGFARKLSGVVFQIRYARILYGEGSIGHGALIQRLDEALANGPGTAVEPPPFNDRPSAPTSAAPKSPWGGYELCRHCRGVLTTLEEGCAGICEGCEGVVGR